MTELPANLYEAHAFVGRRIAGSKSVLDIGCGFGDFGGYAKQLTTGRVDGIEPDPERADRAAERLDVVVNKFAGPDIGPDDGLLESYDAVTFFDVVEHVVDPGPLLRWASDRVVVGGSVLMLIPNSAHWSFRYKVAKGDWSYRDWGLFDRTHLRFYDQRTMGDLPRPEFMRIEAQTPFAPGPPSRWRPLAVDRLPGLFAVHFLVEWRRTA